MTVAYWANVFVCDGRPCIEATYSDEAEALSEIAEHLEGYAWKGHRYLHTLQVVGSTATVADRSMDAQAWDREIKANARLDAQHARGCMHPGA